jgi:hypothetical protein
MKNLKLIRISFLLMFCTFFSCDLINKATDVTFSTTAPVSYIINETSSNPSGKLFSDSKLLNVASDPDVAKYASKIKSFKVDKITYTIYGANPTSVTFSNGMIKIASTGATIASTGSVSLTNSMETQLTTDVNGVNALTASLLSNQQELIQLQGFISQTPVSFTVVFKFYLTISASAL